MIALIRVLIEHWEGWRYRRTYRIRTRRSRPTTAPARWRG